MGDLLIRNIPEALKREIEARRNGRSLSDTAIGLLRKSLIREPASQRDESLSAWDVLRPILRIDDPKEADRYAQIMEEIEAERKRDFGRSVPDLE